MKYLLTLSLSIFSLVVFAQDSKLDTDTIYFKDGKSYIGYLVAEEVTNYQFLIANSKKVSSFPKVEVIKITRGLGSATVRNQGLFPVNDKGEIEYTEVVNVDSTSAEKLYSRAKMCIAEMFISAKDVIQNDDLANKQILIKGKLNATYTWAFGYGCNGTIDFTMIIICKENRYKYSIKPTNHKCGLNHKVYCGGGSLLNERPDCGTFAMPKSYWIDIQSEANTNIKTFIETLKKKMVIDLSGGNDW